MKMAESETEKMAAQLRLWNVMLEKLEAKAKVGRAERKLYKKRIDDARTKLHAAESQFHEYIKAEGGAWDHFKAAIDKAWIDVELAFLDLRG